VEQCVTHSGAPTQRAIPTGDGAKRARQAHAGSRVQEAESQPAGKERADDSRCARGPKWSDVSRDLHVLIVPAPESSPSAASWVRANANRLHSPRRS
jgi:hypothetical protein